jgi:hypothetical protein
MHNPQILLEISKELRRLVEASPHSEIEMEAWNEAARQTYQKLQSKFSEVTLPHQVVHYLHDADIRVKDEEYRENQNQFMLELIRQLEQGVLPQSSGFFLNLGGYKIHLHRWLLTALVLLCGLIWWGTRNVAA